MLRKIALMCAATAFYAMPLPAYAEYPERPITFIIAFGVGGNSDVGGRTVAQYLEPCLGPNATVIPQNRPGANGSVGFEQIATATPDGYTIGVVSFPNGVIQPITKKVPWSKDSFYFFGSFIASSTTLSVAKDSPWHTVDDLIKASKEAPNGLTVGTSGIGSEDQLMLIQLSEITGIKFNIVPFDGDAQSFAGVMGGHIQLVSAASPSTARYLDGVRPIFVAAEKQQPDLLPGTPTAKELGYNIIQGSTHIVAGPPSLPDEIKNKIDTCMEKVAADQEFLAAAKQRSLLIIPKNAQQARQYVDDLDKTIRHIWETAPWQ